MAFRKAKVVVLQSANLSPLATDTTGQLDVLGHDGHPLGVDGAQVGVLEETDQVGLRGFLQSHDSRGLEAKISLEVLGNLTDQTLEWQLPDEELCGLLVTTDLTESDCSRPVTMGFLHSSGGWGTLPGSLGGQLLPWGLASSRFTGGLLGTSHDTCSVASSVTETELMPSVACVVLLCSIVMTSHAIRLRPPEKLQFFKKKFHLISFKSL